MCVAGLHVSTQACNHRWYHLVRACSSERNLANCPDKLRFEGWETRNDSCPWCESEQDLPLTTHRLFGSVPPTSPVSSSPTSPVLLATRPFRSASEGTLSTLSRHGSFSSAAESERGLRQREINERFNLYLISQPHEVLPSARKFYPTSPKDDSPTESDVSSIMSASGVLQRWKRSMSVRMNKGMLNR